MSSSTKKIDALIEALTASGASVTPAPGRCRNRLRVTKKGLPLAWIPTKDPKDWHGLKNKITELRRLGYHI